MTESLTAQQVQETLALVNKGDAKAMVANRDNVKALFELAVQDAGLRKDLAANGYYNLRKLLSRHC